MNKNQQNNRYSSHQNLVLGMEHLDGQDIKYLLTKLVKQNETISKRLDGINRHLSNLIAHEDNLIIDVGIAAELLGQAKGKKTCSKATVRNYIHDGLIETLPTGGGMKFTIKALKDFIRQNSEKYPHYNDQLGFVGFFQGK